MLRILFRHPRALLFAIIVHALFISLLVMSLDLSEIRKAPVIPQQDIVQATSVDESLVKQELKKLKQAETRKEREQRLKAKKAKEARLREEKRLREARKQRQAEQKAEQQRLAKLKKEQQALAKKRKAEEKRIKELAAKRAEEEKRLKEADRQRREDELRRKMEAEQQRLAAENKRLAAEQAARQQSTINKYRIMIEAEIRKHWRVPPGSKPGTVCELRVRLLPSGEVLHVELARSSGNPVFDRSVIQAVKAASPLPVPPANSGLFKVFRELHFPFKLEKKG